MRFKKTRPQAGSCKLATVAVAACLLSACASSPDKIQTAYVSPMQYKDYDCGQIGAELERVSRRAQDLQASLQKKADDDGAQMAVGMILFWPALFFLEGGDGPEAAEYGRLKGEREALDKLAVQKRCTSGGAPATPVAPASPAPEAAVEGGDKS